jgi:hypothetical protein
MKRSTVEFEIMSSYVDRILQRPRAAKRASDGTLTQMDRRRMHSVEGQQNLQ